MADRNDPRGRGPFSGLGPQNNRRTDESILDQINERLTQHGQIDAREVSVGVSNGEVVLNGSVATSHQKRLVEETAYSVSGVVEVQNNLHVTHQEQGRGDYDIRDPRAQGEQAPLSEASNLGDDDIHHPTTMSFSEVRPITRERSVGGDHTGVPVTDGSTPGNIPSTGGASVMDAGAADAMKVSGSEIDEDSLGHLLREDMEVVDRNGDGLGKVKVVRSTDFWLDRRFARDFYVPYHVCRVEDDRVVVDIDRDEINDQGWAMPGTA
jgi:hypothetical protein